MSRGPERVKAWPEATQETLAVWEQRWRPDRSPQLATRSSALGRQTGKLREPKSCPSPLSGPWRGAIRNRQSSSESLRAGEGGGLLQAVCTRHCGQPPSFLQERNRLTAQHRRDAAQGLRELQAQDTEGGGPRGQSREAPSLRKISALGSNPSSSTRGAA